MQVTKIAKVGKQDKFAIFIDGTLKLFLTGQSILDHNLRTSEEINEDQLDKLNKLSTDDQLYLKALKYLSHRLRSEGEMKQYLKKQAATIDQQQQIISRLKELELINDERFVAAYIHDKLLQTPASKRKISYELKKKLIAKDIIDNSLSGDQISDEDSLIKLIDIKRRQTKYQDDLKLMQYLVRNGFNYTDVKKALKTEDPEAI